MSYRPLATPELCDLNRGFTKPLGVKMRLLAMKPSTILAVPFKPVSALAQSLTCVLALTISHSALAHGDHKQNPDYNEQEEKAQKRKDMLCHPYVVSSNPYNVGSVLK